MTMMVRTDIHRPSAEEFDPEAYICLGVFDLHPEDGDNARRQEVVRHQRELGYDLAPHQRERGAGQCGHCGAHLRYAALLRHEISGELIYVGETCLLGRFESLTKSEFQRLRAAAALSSERRRLGARAAAQIECAPGLAEAVYVAGLADVASSFVSDVIAKLFQYGELSVRQVNAVVPAAGRDLARALDQITRAAELAADPVHALLSNEARCASLGSFVASVGAQYRDRGRISDNQRAAVQRVLDRPAPLEPGIYESPEGEVFKVQMPRAGGSGRPYAKVLMINNNVRRLTEVSEVVNARYEYDGAAIHRVRAEWKVSLDRAKELGHLTAICIVCGAKLEDAVSVREGVGPRCGGRV